jgi:hypothetical protein
MKERMVMKREFTLVLVSAVAWWVSACNIVDDEPTLDDSGGTGGPTDNDVCIAQLETLKEVGCPPGYELHAVFDGSDTTVVLVDDPAAAIGLGVGLVVHFGGKAGADWVGYEVSQGPTCSVGCFAPSCGEGQYGCYAIDPVTNGLCTYYCQDDVIEQQACDELAESCLGDPGMGDGGGLDETGGGEGGTDENGGETTGGVMDEPFDCSRWHPEVVAQPEAGGPFRVPQTLVDQLVLESGDSLVECDGLRLRPSSAGHWTISKMRHAGLLGALGLRVGDELRQVDDVELDSLDALASVLGRFIDDDGNPRQFEPSHPAFSLRVRREREDFVRRLRVVPATDESHGGGR